MTAPIQLYGPYRRSRLRRNPTARALLAWLGVAALALVAAALVVGLPFAVGVLSAYLGL